MKKLLTVGFCMLSFLLSILSTQSQTIAYKGIYIDTFDGIVGNTIKEDSLLHYLKDSSFNSIICYRMSNVVSSTVTSTKNSNLASFLKKARTQYGIKNVLASSESYSTFNTLIAPYNRSRNDSNERFNYFYLEFEFWNVHSTSPVSSANNGYYCSTYLSPKGYSCDTAGAFKYYKKMLKSLDSLANKDGIRSATYVGNPNMGQCKFIANTVDLLFCDNYTSSINNIYSDVKLLFSYFGSTAKTLQIVPIFASYSPGGNFLGDWLTKTPTGPHSEKGVYTNYFLPRYTAETAAWKAKLNLIGYQWYRYSGMPHNGNFSSGNFCTSPTNLIAANVTSTSATLSWLSNSSSLAYTVQYRIVGSTSWLGPIGSTAKNITLSNLRAGSNYEFQVSSSCISSSSAYSASSQFSTSNIAACGIPIGLTANAITANTATLSWMPTSGASSYKVQYRKVGSSSWTSNSSSTTSIALQSLSASSIYEIQVRSNCASGSSAYSASYLFSTPAPVCSIPTTLTTSSLTSNSVTLKWAAISGVSGYTLQYRLIGTTTWATTTSTTNSKSILALTANSNYEFQVQTKCSSTNASNYSTTANFTTLPSGCGTPLLVQATAATTNSFTISWQASAMANSYKIQYKKVSASTWITTSTTNTLKNISSLSAATTYEFQVAAVCAAGTSTYSPISSITTLSNALVCETPTGLFASNNNLSSVTLNWLTVNGANSYKVQYRKSGSSSWNNKTTSFTNKNITGLIAHTTYEYQVQTICSSGQSAFSISGYFVTSPAALALRLSNDSSNLPTEIENKSLLSDVSIEQLKNPEIIVFPNPTTRENINVRIQLNQKESVRLHLYDITGKLLFDETIVTDENGFLEYKLVSNVELKVGTYIVKATTSESSIHSKLIIK